MSKWIGIVVVILVLVIAAIWIVRGSAGTMVAGSPEPSSSVSIEVPAASPQGTGETIPSEGTTVTVTSAGFDPAAVTITAGMTVTWVNQSGGAIAIDSDPHPVHTSYPPLNLGNVADGASVSLQFTAPGTYHYHNHLNPSQKGTIVVQ